MFLSSQLEGIHEGNSNVSRCFLNIYKALSTWIFEQKYAKKNGRTFCLNGVSVHWRSWKKTCHFQQKTCSPSSCELPKNLQNVHLRLHLCPHVKKFWSTYWCQFFKWDKPSKGPTKVSKHLNQKKGRKKTRVLGHWISISNRPKNFQKKIARWAPISNKWGGHNPYK